MANEFIIRNGFISKDSSLIEGMLSVNGILTATTISATTYQNLPSRPITIVTGSTTLSNINQIVIVNSSLPITINLPQITSNDRLITIKNTNAGIETILPFSGQLIDGETSFIVARQNVSLDLLSYNNNWVII